MKECKNFVGLGDTDTLIIEMIELNWNVVMWCKFTPMYNFAVYFLPKLLDKFKVDVNLDWSLLHNSSYFPYLSYWNIEWIFFYPF